MRLAAALFIAAHGVGYSIWFMSAWTPSTMGTQSKTLTLFPDAQVTGLLGKGIGLAAVAIMVGFLVSAWGIWQEAAWWPISLIATAAVSLPVALAVWNPVGIVSVPATVASVTLILATVMPWGERFLGTH
jgi:hypothetical protein